MEAVITKDLAIKAVLHGSCRIPKVGEPISRLSTQDLIWGEEKGFVSESDKKKIGVNLPLWVLSGSGSGSGYGDGDGSGYGDGYGYGDGSGSSSGLLGSKNFKDLLK